MFLGYRYQAGPQTGAGHPPVDGRPGPLSASMNRGGRSFHSSPHGVPRELAKVPPATPPLSPPGVCPKPLSTRFPPMPGEPGQSTNTVESNVNNVFAVASRAAPSLAEPNWRLFGFVTARAVCEEDDEGSR